MPVLSKRFSERNPITLGLAGIVVVVLLVGGSLGSAGAYRALTAQEYIARFAEAGGLIVGDRVRLAGLEVGEVTDIRLEGGAVTVAFGVEGGSLGDRTRASIKTATVLGKKFLQVYPDGRGELPDGMIPLARTSSPYDVQDQLGTLTREVSEVDVPQLADSLNTLSDTLADTPERLRVAVDGVSRVSQTIASRDEALRGLLESANGVTGLLAERSGEITKLVADGDLLLSELSARRDAIRALLVHTTAVVDELDGLAADNRDQLGPALAELDGVLDLLIRNEDSLTASIEGLRNYTGSLGEAVSGGPWFYGYVPNLTGSSFSQQTLTSILDQLPPTQAAPGTSETSPR
jgi:virulence factor Mce family protein